MDEKLKICAECRFVDVEYDGFRGCIHIYKCNHPTNKTRDLVSGDYSLIQSNDTLRSCGGKCGPSGALFEHKEVKPSWWETFCAFIC